tara:strand:- start:214 stop:585 length:372 start_codon:yes stop_codon:yes gene_type:complete
MSSTEEQNKIIEEGQNKIIEDGQNENIKEEEHSKRKNYKNRNIYMREYMRTYNIKKVKEPKNKRVALTPEEKKERLKINQHKYYEKNKQKVINRHKIYRNNLKIKNLTDKLNLLKSLNVIVEN